MDTSLGNTGFEDLSKVRVARKIILDKAPFPRTRESRHHLLSEKGDRRGCLRARNCFALSHDGISSYIYKRTGTPPLKQCGFWATHGATGQSKPGHPSHLLDQATRATYRTRPPGPASENGPQRLGLSLMKLTHLSRRPFPSPPLCPPVLVARSELSSPPPPPRTKPSQASAARTGHRVYFTSGGDCLDEGPPFPSPPQPPVLVAQITEIRRQLTKRDS